MLEGFDFTVSYAPVTGILSLHIITAIESIEGLVLFVLYTSNAFHNTILPHPSETFYLILPHLYLECYKVKCPNHPPASINQK